MLVPKNLYFLKPLNWSGEAYHPQFEEVVRIADSIVGRHIAAASWWEFRSGQGRWASGLADSLDAAMESAWFHYVERMAVALGPVPVESPATEWKTISEPGAHITVKSAPIPPDIAEAIADALSR